MNLSANLVFKVLITIHSSNSDVILIYSRTGIVCLISSWIHPREKLNIFLKNQMIISNIIVFMVITLLIYVYIVLSWIQIWHIGMDIYMWLMRHCFLGRWTCHIGRNRGIGLLISLHLTFVHCLLHFGPSSFCLVLLPPTFWWLFRVCKFFFLFLDEEWQCDNISCAHWFFKISWRFLNTTCSVQTGN